MPVIAVIAIDRRAERAYFSSFGSSGFKTSVLHANNRTIFPQEVENSKPCSSAVAAYARERDFSSHAHSRLVTSSGGGLGFIRVGAVGIRIRKMSLRFPNFLGGRKNLAPHILVPSVFLPQIGYPKQADAFALIPGLRCR